jgi:hypothetical protein
MKLVLRHKLKRYNLKDYKTYFITFEQANQPKALKGASVSYWNYYQCHL